MSQKLASVMDLTNAMKSGKRTPGFVVFEGLDGSGKSTQIKMLQRRYPGQFWAAHQPSSGLESIPGMQLALPQYDSEDEWKALKRELSFTDPLTLWALHLAAHAESYKLFEPHFQQESQVLWDRFWWSAYAYNFCAGELSQKISSRSFLSLELAATKGFQPELILFFVGTFGESMWNTKEQSYYNQTLNTAYRDLIKAAIQTHPESMYEITITDRTANEIHSDVVTALSHASSWRLKW